jgi:hypothetical protein
MYMSVILSDLFSVHQVLFAIVKSNLSLSGPLSTLCHSQMLKKIHTATKFHHHLSTQISIPFFIL